MPEDDTEVYLPSPPCARTAAELLALLARLPESQREPTLALVRRCAGQPGWWESLRERTVGHA
jgi:hypothetical protein